MIKDMHLETKDRHLESMDLKVLNLQILMNLKIKELHLESKDLHLETRDHCLMDKKNHIMDLMMVLLRKKSSIRDQPDHPKACCLFQTCHLYLHLEE